jgi:hypothetical protein
MKYLKKFEAKLKTIQYKDMTDWGSTEPQKVKAIDPEYFNLVFADFIDEGAEADWNEKEDVYEPYWEIFIEEKPKIRGSRDIDKHIEDISKLSELYLDIKSCINKVKDEYTHINVDFSIEESGENTIWSNTIERKIHLEFSYK